MRDLLSIVMVLVLTFVSTSLVPSIMGATAVPLISLFFVIGLTYFQKGVGPILIAALAGVLLDFLSASSFGLYLGLFLMTAVTIRFLFQEGMKEMSLGHYMGIAGTFLLLYFGIEVLMIYLGGSTLSITGIAKPFLVFTAVNIVSALFMYLLNVKYFEAIQKLER